MAWLHAVPETLKRSRLAEAEAHAEARGEPLQLELPPVSAAYFTEDLFEVGPFMEGGVGPAALTFHEIQAWMDLTGRELEPWAVRLLRQLSKAYLAELQAATKPDHPPPWQPEPDQETRETVAEKAKRQFGSRAARSR